MIITEPIAQALFVQSDNDSSVIFTTFICFQYLFSIDLDLFIVSWFKVDIMWILYCLKVDWKLHSQPPFDSTRIIK